VLRHLFYCRFTWIRTGYKLDQQHCNLGSGAGKTWFKTGQFTWIKTVNNEDIPLNINLLIPFKDNKGQRQKLYLGELSRFVDQLENRVGELKTEITDQYGQEFPLALVARSDGTSKRYFWRFKPSKMDRKYNRLYADSVVEFLEGYDRSRRLRLKEIEQEVIYINANLKLVKVINDTLERSKEESAMLLKTAW